MPGVEGASRGAGDHAEREAGIVGRDQHALAAVANCDRRQLKEAILAFAIVSQIKI
jgi:hypothetical protein